jgi:WD40 repeat protein
MTETAQDFQNAQLTVSDHRLEGHGFRVCGVAFSPDGRRAMTGSWWDNTAWVRDLPGSSPRERTFNARRARARHLGDPPMPPFPWCLPVTPIRLPVSSPRALPTHRA